MIIDYRKLDEIDKNLYEDLLVYNKKTEDYELKKEKKKVYVANVDDKEITVTYSLSAKMNGVFSEYRDAILGSSSHVYFDPESAAKLAKEEAESDSRDSYENCGEYVYNPFTEIMPGAKELTSEQVGNRALLFAKLCQLASNDTILQVIAESAAKKKNGLLYKGRILRIACVYAVDSYMDYYELYGRAKDDTNLEVSVRKNSLNYKNLDHMYDNLSAQIDFFNPSKASIVPKKVVATEKKRKEKGSTNSKKVLTRKKVERDIIEFEVPEGIEVIDKEAFKNCHSLKKITFPNTLKTIGEMAFCGCRFKELIIPEGVEEIKSGAFKDCELERVVLPSSVKEIAEKAFYSCSALSEVVIPEGVERIGAGSFYMCANLSKITFPTTLREIKDHAFCYSGVQDVVLPDGLLTMGKNVFAECKKLNSIIFPSTLKVLPTETCTFCEELKKIEIPDGIEIIEARAFCHCEKLDSIELPSTLKEMGRKAFRACSFEEIVIPEGVSLIGENAFEGCENLRSLKLPSTLKTIQREAFYACIRLEKVEIPASVSTMGVYAFAECDDLETIVIYGKPRFKAEVFESCDKATIYCTADNYDDISVKVDQPCQII